MTPETQLCSSLKSRCCRNASCLQQVIPYILVLEKGVPVMPQLYAERAGSGSVAKALRARAQKHAAEAHQRALHMRRICLGEAHPQTRESARHLQLLSRERA